MVKGQWTYCIGKILLSPRAENTGVVSVLVYPIAGLVKVHQCGNATNWTVDKNGMWAVMGEGKHTGREQCNAEEGVSEFSTFGPGTVKYNISVEVK